MKTDEFNAESSVPRYHYNKSEANPRCFVIVKDGKGFVGDYTVLDEKEDLAFTEKKVANLIAILNGRNTLEQVGEGTGIRVLYQIVTRKDDEGFARVLFYNLGNEGVSVKNALLRIEEDGNIIE